MQRIYYVYLLQKSKRGYYENLNLKNITDNQLFWKSVKPSDKSRIRDVIIVSEISDESTSVKRVNFKKLSQKPLNF